MQMLQIAKKQQNYFILELIDYTRFCIIKQPIFNPTGKEYDHRLYVCIVDQFQNVLQKYTEYVTSSNTKDSKIYVMGKLKIQTRL